MVKLLATICIVATCVMMVAATPSECSPAPSPAAPVTTDCSSLVYDLMDCMEFLVAGGSETTPDNSCCLGFKTLMETNEDCMCYALDTSASFGLDINITRAETLPTDCGVSSPPISTCNMSTSPTGSPAESPIFSPPTLPPAATPSRGGEPSSPPSASVCAPAAASELERAPTMGRMYGPVAEPAKKSGACVISTTFSAFVLIILIFLV